MRDLSMPAARMMAAWGIAAACLAGWAAAPSAGAAEGDKPARTVIGDTPWLPDPLPAGAKVIYGTDDRIDLFEETDPVRRTWAASTCALIERNRLTGNPDGTFTIQTASYDVCPDEPFANQPTASFCSGFVVGPDLIATAGHCYDSGNISGTRFVFGFAMEDATTPVLDVAADQVYTGVEVVGRALSGNLDYAVVRVDREITAPGAVPFEIRREGVVPAGQAVGVIGHPFGLPLKLAFGDTTAVRSSDNEGFFVANLDTYAGNSGSPVIDPETGIVEGILVRGETDFINDGGCRRSNVLPDSGGNGEEVSKTTTFAGLVPLLVGTNGQLALDREQYGCSDTVAVTLRDSDLAGAGAAEVTATTTGGDLEILVLEETGLAGEFAGEISIATGTPMENDGVLHVAEGETVFMTYQDMLHDAGAPDEVEVSAIIDCTAPAVEQVAVSMVGSQFAVVSFSTGEPASGTVRVGLDCASTSVQASFTQAFEHSVTVTGLTPLTRYYFDIVARDEAGNRTVADNDGACFPFETVENVNYHTELFDDSRPIDLMDSTVLFTPDGSGGYTVCRESISELPVGQTGSSALLLGDDAFMAVALSGGVELAFEGSTYDTVFVNSNGNVTFEGGDTAYAQSIEEHFDAPRVSPYFADLDPSAAGQIWYRQLGDRFAVTWQDVPRFAQTAPNTVQLELFFDGRIRFSYLDLAGEGAFVGLSAGLGLMPDFTTEDFSAAPTCMPVEIRHHSADTNADFAIDLQELLRVVQFFNLDGYHCDPAGEDGYGAGPGEVGCTPHDADYNPQDWQISLSEALRMVQFFNTVGYAYDPGSGSEDGFVPIVAE